MSKYTIIKPTPKPVPASVKTYINNKLDKIMEDKFVNFSLTDVTYGFPSVGNAWTERELNLVAAGTESNQRTGRRIKLKSLEIKGTLAAGASGNVLDDPYNNMRIVIGLYDESTPLTTGSATMFLPIMRTLGTNGSLIKKYLDKFVALNVTSTEKGQGDGYAPQCKTFKFYKKWKKGIFIDYIGTDADDGTKFLYMSCISDSAAVPNPGFVTGYILLKYEDA